MKLVIERKKRPRSHYAHYQRGLRKAELAFVSELRREATFRANKRLKLLNIDGMLKDLYRQELREAALSLKARKAALEAAVRGSLGEVK